VSGRHRLQWLLVAVQVALSVVLLATAGLLLRSFQELSRVDLGFEPGRVLAFRVSSSWNETGNMIALNQLTEGILEGLRALPGVEAAAVATTAPGVPNSFEQEFELVEDRAAGDGRLVAGSLPVSPSYFSTLSIPVVAGELCRLAPLDASWREVMVNRTFADQYLSGASAIGLHLVVARLPVEVRRPGRIVGIVADARERGIDREAAPTVYLCGRPAEPFRVFLARTRGEPMVIAQAVRLKVKEIEPLRSVYDVAPLEAWIGDAFAQNRLRAILLASFAALALALACVGLYGTLSYVVSLRRREIGLRLALGARRGVIVRQYLLKGLQVACLACAAGLALALGFGRLVSGMLYGVSPYDPATLSGVVFVVLVVAALSSLLPATRAALVEPMQVLREE
jgi:putative ABC transport system permease protein